MDVATGEYGDMLLQLTSGVENGRLIYNEFSESILATPSQDGNTIKYLPLYRNKLSSILEIRKYSSIRKRSESLNNVKQDTGSRDQLPYAAPFHTQVSVLFERTWRTILREKVQVK